MKFYFLAIFLLIPWLLTIDSEQCKIEAPKIDPPFTNSTEALEYSITTSSSVNPEVSVPTGSPECQKCTDDQIKTTLIGTLAEIDHSGPCAVRTLECVTYFVVMKLNNDIVITHNANDEIVTPGSFKRNLTCGNDGNWMYENVKITSASCEMF